MNLATKIINAIFGKKKVVHVDLDPESVKKHNLVRAMANEKSELLGEIAELKSIIGKSREREEDKKEDENVRWELDNQRKEIIKNKNVNFFSLSSFFNRVSRNKKFRKQLGFYDRKRGKKLASFGDIGFSSDGRIALFDDKGGLVMAMERIHDIFASVEGLETDAKNKIISLNVNSEGEYIENIEVQDIPEIYVTPEGKFQYTKAKKRKVYEYINDLNNQVADGLEELKEMEVAFNNLQMDNSKLKVENKRNFNMVEVLRKEVSVNEKDYLEMKDGYMTLTKQLAQVRDTNANLNDDLDSLRTILERVRDLAEGEQTKDKLKQAVGMILDIRKELQDQDSNEEKVPRMLEQVQKPQI